MVLDSRMDGKDPIQLLVDQQTGDLVGEGEAESDRRRRAASRTPGSSPRSEPMAKATGGATPARACPGAGRGRRREAPAAAVERHQPAGVRQGGEERLALGGAALAPSPVALVLTTTSRTGIQRSMRWR